MVKVLEGNKPIGMKEKTTRGRTLLVGINLPDGKSGGESVKPQDATQAMFSGQKA